ncbi:MAG: anhydro-N-acetylmuramic acid kinase [Bacteroidota bacterium]
MEEEQQMIVLGLMSGSSLDGIDLAVGSFRFQQQPGFTLKEWKLLQSVTIPYPPTWQARLRTAPHLPGRELWRLHTDLGHFYGQMIRDFLQKNELTVDLIGSHGHTVFHHPEKSFTTQIGDGAAIAHISQVPTVDQLRTMDVAAGGQGAPIAPIADHYLLAQYRAFLNLGGIANVSLKGPDDSFLAGDVSGANQILDQLAATFGQTYDDGGRIAAGGQVLPDLMEQIRNLPYHQQACPKSLDNAWVRETLWPIISRHPGEAADKMHTFCHFLAAEVQRVLVDLAQRSKLASQAIRVLVTGGGTHNQFLLRCLREQPQDDQFPLGYEAADATLADAKEALMVALSALLRKLAVPNVLASATGASSNTINGALYLP